MVGISIDNAKVVIMKLVSLVKSEITPKVPTGSNTNKPFPISPVKSVIVSVDVNEFVSPKFVLKV